VIECEPRLKVEVEKLNVPAFSVPEKIGDAPSLKTTVPVGVAVTPEVTVAVNVTDCPTADGLAEEMSAVVLAAWVTDCDSVAEVLAANVVFAEYVAVMACTPAGRSVVVNVAVPADRVPVPMPAPLSENVTVPVGVPEPLVTVAVSVIEAPKDAGLSDEATVVVVGMPLTTWLRIVDVLGSKVASP